MHDAVTERNARFPVGLTVVYVTHDQAEALAVSDRIVVMRNAGIAQAGTPEGLYARPGSVFVATFMGEANHLRGRIERVADGVATVALDALRIELPDRGLPPGEADLVARPEALIVGDAGGPGLPGRILRAIYMGSHAEAHVETPVREVFVIGRRALARRAPGSAVSLTFGTEGVALVQP